jgi:hypothetical protein
MFCGGGIVSARNRVRAFGGDFGGGGMHSKNDILFCLFVKTGV